MLKTATVNVWLHGEPDEIADAMIESLEKSGALDPALSIKTGEKVEVNLRFNYKPSMERAPGPRKYDNGPRLIMGSVVKELKPTFGEIHHQLCHDLP